MISSIFLPIEDPDADEEADLKGEKERSELAREREVKRSEESVLQVWVPPGKETVESGREEEVEGGRGMKGWVWDRKTLKGTGRVSGCESLARRSSEDWTRAEEELVGGLYEIRKGGEGGEGGRRMASVRDG